MYPKVANRVHVFWGISGKTMGEGHRNKNIKNQPFGDATDLTGEVGGIAKRIKTARLRR